MIAAPDEAGLWLNGNGSPWLATAGSGDVLAGIVGGLIWPRGWRASTRLSAAVWIHAEAAAEFRARA